jgi:hypothetical protein
MYTYCLNIILLLNPKLYNDTEYIDLYDHTGFLFGYNTTNLNSPFFINKKKIKKELIGTELIAKFSKKRILTKEQEENVFKTMQRTPRDVIYEYKFIIPNIKSYSDNQCSICLDDVIDEKNKYITTCGHIYHLNCICTFLETNNLLYPLHNYCSSKFGCHTRHSKPFNCPVCNNFAIP